MFLLNLAPKECAMQIDGEAEAYIICAKQCYSRTSSPGRSFMVELVLPGELLLPCPESEGEIQSRPWVALPP